MEKVVFHEAFLVGSLFENLIVKCKYVVEISISSTQTSTLFLSVFWSIKYFVAPALRSTVSQGHHAPLPCVWFPLTPPPFA